MTNSHSSARRRQLKMKNPLLWILVLCCVAIKDARAFIVRDMTDLHPRRCRRFLCCAKDGMENTKSTTGEGSVDSYPVHGKKKNGIAKKKSEIVPDHWLDDSDEFRIEYANNKLSLLHFKVRGNPKSLQRHRTGRGYVYNPSASLQDSFRQQVMTLIDLPGLATPLFDEEDCLLMSLILRMKRPKSHFVGSKPGPGRLKPTAPPATTPQRNDVDNLVKFVMDSMNTILYPDDRQIASLHVTRILDNEETCEGSTEICIRKIREEDLDRLLINSFTITGP